MPPKRKAAKKPAAAATKKANKQQDTPPADTVAKASPEKTKAIGSLSAAELWESPDYVLDGKMTVRAHHPHRVIIAPA